MSEFQNFANEYLILSLYTLCIGLFFMVMSHIISRYKPYINLWRDYWLVLIVLIILPIVFSVMPFSNENSRVFDLNQLQMQMNKLVFFEGVAYSSEQLHNESSLNLFNTISLIWLSIYFIGFFYAAKCLMAKIKAIFFIIKNAEDIYDNKELLGRQNYRRLNYLQKNDNIKIVITPIDISPFVFQWQYKFMVIPQSLFNNPNISQQEIELIIDHEMTHIKNKDQLIVMISHILICVLWFNPFVKLFQKKMNWALEAHCDSEVLNNKPHLRKIYAHTMLKILRQSATTTSNQMVAAFSTKTHRNLTMRINNIMKPLHPEVKLKSKKKKLWAGALSLGLIMFITQPQSNTNNNIVKTEMINPVQQAKISSPYGANNKIHQFHKGIDLKAAINTPIIAASAGVVRVSTDQLENQKNYGTIIIIDHADGFHSVYSHLNSRSVSAGERVEAGQLIGYVGETGKTTGPHLHLELLKDNKHVNPSDYIKF